MADDRLVVRAMTVADIEPVRALARETWEHHYVPIIGAAQIQYMLAQRYTAEVLRDELARGDLWWDLALIGGVARGYASCFEIDGGLGMKLDKLYVHPEFQRTGLGARLLERVLGRAGERGARRLVLAVNKRNATAIAAYRKWGFSVEAALVQDIGGGFVMDDYVMARQVEAAG